MNNNIAEIRYLLDLWYDAETDRMQERRLERLLRSTPSLPADLEADRDLFLGLVDMTGEEEVEIPSPYAARVSEAIEREISASRRPHSARIRRFLFAGGIAAAVLGAFFLLRPAINTDSGLSSPGLATVTEKPVRESVQPVSPEEIYPATEEKEVPAAPAPANSRRVKKSVKSVAAPARNDDHTEDWEYLSAEEEAELIACNYRVIDNEEEAYAMINGMVSRLESHLINQDNMQSEVMTQYDAEVSRLY